MAVEKVPSGNTPQTNELATNKGHAALAWHHFLSGLSDKKISDQRSSLPRNVQE